MWEVMPEVGAAKGSGGLRARAEKEILVLVSQSW